MLRVDERRDAARLLRFGDGVDGQRRLARRFGTVDLHDAAFGISAHSEGDVERDRTRRNYRYVADFLRVHTHDRPFAEVFFYFFHHCVEHFELIRIYLYFFCHCLCLLFFLFFIFSAASFCRGLLGCRAACRLASRAAAGTAGFGRPAHGRDTDSSCRPRCCRRSSATGRPPCSCRV